MNYWNIQRVPVNAQGYDPQGSYWGVGQPLFWYCDPECKVEGYERAIDRTALRTRLNGRKMEGR